VLDLDAYLERIGVHGHPSLAELHRAHLCSIPFENLDPHRGVPVSLDQEALERKLVTERRGGYCFEHNLLLKSALEALGAEVELVLARVRAGAPYGAVRPRSHLLLRVQIDNAVWHADVGFGTSTPLEPIPFGPDGVHEQSGWRFRVVADGPEYVLQSADGSDWNDLYGFVPEPAPFVDLVTSNWFTCTHPHSPFVTGLIVALHQHDGTGIALSDWDELVFTESSPGIRSVTPVTRDQVPDLLEGRFGLPGFTLNGDGRVVPVAGGE
jgi:N-hydroxyarylamine O-acetyltransferase